MKNHIRAETDGTFISIAKLIKVVPMNRRVKIALFCEGEIEVFGCAIDSTCYILETQS